MSTADTPNSSPDSEPTPTGVRSAPAQTPPKQKAKPRPPASRKESSWLASKAQKLASWLATTEPSAQALRQYRKESFRKAGISPTDTEPPHVKLRAPIGDIPPDAIRPASGPTPEAMARKKVAERRKKQRHGGRRSSGVLGGGEQTSSEGSWSIYRGQGSAGDSRSAFPYAGSSS